ncbi:MAG: hypothetical protein NVV74_00630 [Magnetospirillum sp.]|nr:hypothetical protein [Magnetospirillum sp.]
MPANELATAEGAIARAGRLVAGQVDLDAVLRAAGRARPLAAVMPAARATVLPQGRIGIARDAAFGFYYAEDLDMLEAEGFALVPFDTLRDPCLPPDLDGLFLGGGFPETHMAGLEANVSLRADIRRALAGGLPTYAECGGMMYLSRSIGWAGRRAAMVGALPADAVMGERPQGRGYAVLEETGASPWPRPGSGGRLAAHEFHYAGLVDIAAEARFAYRVVRGHGIGGGHDGLVVGNTLASFCHLRGVGSDPWPRRFAAFIRACRATARPAFIPWTIFEESSHDQAEYRRPQHLLPRPLDGVDRRHQAI